MQHPGGPSVHQNALYHAKLSGVIRYDNAQPVAQHLAYFVIGEDLSVQSTGGDPFGQYAYHGTVTVDGRLSLVRKYYMNDHLPALFLQGTLNDEGSLGGVVLETVPNFGTVHRGTFEFTPMTHFWKGEYSESTGRKGPLELSFFMGPTIYGFGKLNGSVYSVKGSYEPFTHRVVLHEFNANKSLKQRLFEGIYTPAGGKIQGTFKTPSNDSGSFKLEFCQEGYSAAPRMDVIDAQPIDVNQINPAGAPESSQPNFAKLPPIKPAGSSNPTNLAKPTQATGTGPDYAARQDISQPPNFTVLAGVPTLGPAYGMMPPAPGMHPGAAHPGMVWMSGATAPVYGAPVAFAQHEVPFTQRVTGVDRATKMEDLLGITQQLHQGKLIPRS